MTKIIYILAVVGITIVAGLGAFFFEFRNSQNKVKTLGEWQTCRSNSHYKICDDIMRDQKKLNQCYQAATDFASICYPNHSQTTQECQNFWNFYNTQATDDVLPEDYFTCVNQGLNAAKESQFFYENNYLLLWVDCATTKS